jgi:hypothetical protein
MPAFPNITQTVYFNGAVPTNDNWANTGLTFEPGQSYSVSAEQAALLLASGMFGASQEPTPPNLSIINRRSTVGLLGDSFVVRDMAEEGPNWYGFRNTTSLFTWTNILLGQRFNPIYWDGVTGSSPVAWAADARLNNLIAAAPDYAWLSGDPDGGDTALTYAQLVAAYSKIFDACRAAGIKVITHTQPPSNQLTTAATRARTQNINAWLKSVATREYGVIVVEVAGASLLSTSLTYQPNTTTLTDGVHYQCPGAFQAACLMAQVLDPIVPKWQIPWLNSYDLSSGFTTQALPSPIMVGTGGGVSVLTTTTGVPAGWSANITAGESGTVNTSARADLQPGNWLDYACTFTATDKQATLTQSSASNLGGKVVGDTVQFFCEMKIDTATAARIKFPFFYVEFRGAGTKYATAFDVGNTPTQPLSAASFALKTSNDIYVFGTKPMQIPPSSTGYNWNVGVMSSGAGTCNFSIGRICLV